MASGEDGGGRSRRQPGSPGERRARRAEIGDPAVILDAAARFLEARPRSVEEVRRRLTGAGYREDLVRQAILRLIELGMLDDEAFARGWVESRDRARPRGRHALRRELRLKGIAAGTIEEVLAEREDEVLGRGDAILSADEQAAELLLARKAGAIARVSDPRLRRQRAYALLVRAGFDTGVATRLATRLGSPDASEVQNEDLAGE